MSVERRIIGVLVILCIVLSAVTIWALATRGDEAPPSGAGLVLWVANDGDDAASPCTDRANPACGCPVSRFSRSRTAGTSPAASSPSRNSPDVSVRTTKSTAWSACGLVASTDR